MIHVQIKDREILFVLLRRSKKGIVVHNVLRFEYPAGLIVNGYIQDIEQLQNKLSEFVRKYRLRQKKIVLTLDSTFVVYREVVTPVLRNKQLEAYLYHHLQQQVSSIEDYVIDYAVLKKQKKLQLLAVMMPVVLLENYKTVFAKAKLKLHRVTTSPLNVIRGDQFNPSKPVLKSHVIMSFNGDVMNTVLLNHGDYVFSTAYRTFDSAEPATIILERISQMMQFQKAQNLGIKVDRVLFYGNVDIVLLEKIGDALDIEIVTDTMPSKITNESRTSMFGAMVNIFAALPSSLRNYNLLDGIDQSRYAKKVVQKQRMALIIAALVVNVVILAAVGGLFYYQLITQKQLLSEYETRVARPALNTKYTQAVEQLRLLGLYDRHIEEIDAVSAHLKSQQAFHFGLYQSIVASKPADVSWSSFRYADNMIYLIVQTKVRESTYRFVRTLRNSDLFHDIEYNGFTVQNGTYSYDLVLTLKAGDEK